MAEVTPRKNELDAVIAVMESDEYEDAKATARAIVKALYNEWRRREWWVVAHKVGPTAGFTTLHGLEPSEKAAERFAQGMGTGIATPLMVFPVGAFEDRLEDMKRDEWTRRRHPCADCGHPKELHGAIGYKGKPVKVPAGKACAANCRCKAFREPPYPEEEGEAA